MDMSALVAQLIPQIVQGSQRVQQTASQIPTDSVPLPPHGFGYNPKFQPITGQGFGGGVKNLLGDILKGAALIGSSTRQGRAIEQAYYGPGVNQYEAQRQQRASQIEATKSKGALEASATGELGQAAGTASLAGYRGAVVGIREEDERIKQQKADQEGQRIASQNAIGLQRVQQGWEKLTQAQQAQKFKQWYQGALIQVANARVSAGLDENSARIDAQKDLASALAQNNYVRSNPLISEVLGAFGVPQFEQAPGAQTTPVTKPNSKGAKAGANQAGPAKQDRTIYDPQGVPHNLKAGYPVPKGWSLTPPKRK